VADYPNLPARYTKGTLKLRRRLRLPEGTEVRVSITLPQSKSRTRRLARRQYTYPTRSLPPHTLQAIAGMASLGGDALADSEALYDRD
jgi:predicted DNA-binding antitoxin AbrB/MazE fold protein